MTTDVRITAIVPAYNRADTVSAAVDSLLSQSSPLDEIIVVDDASTDSTSETLAAFGDRITVLHHPENRGVSAARNTGLEAARGEFIYFLDSDDVALRCAVAACRETLARSEVDMVVGRSLIAHPDGRLTVSPDVRASPAFAGARYSLLPGAFLISRGWLSAVGGFREGLRYSEHTDLRARLAPDIESGRRTVAVRRTPLMRMNLRSNRYDPQTRLESAATLLAANEERLSLDPRLIATYAAIAGVACERLGNPPAAVTWHARAMAKEPTNPRHMARLARAGFRTVARALGAGTTGRAGPTPNGTS